MLGMTQLELLVTLAIAALLTTFAIPSLTDLVRDYRATAAINGIVGQVQYLRSTAITARRPVTLCLSLIHI